MPRQADLVDFLFAPMAYSVWWVIGAVLIVLLIAAWVVGVFVWTLPIEVLRRIPVIRNVAFRVLRFKFARSLVKVADRHHQGRLDTRRRSMRSAESSGFSSPTARATRHGR